MKNEARTGANITDITGRNTEEFNPATFGGIGAAAASLLVVVIVAVVLLIKRQDR